MTILRQVDLKSSSNRTQNLILKLHKLLIEIHKRRMVTGHDMRVVITDKTQIIGGMKETTDPTQVADDMKGTTIEIKETTTEMKEVTVEMRGTTTEMKGTTTEITGMTEGATIRGATTTDMPRQKLI